MTWVQCPDCGGSGEEMWNPAYPPDPELWESLGPCPTCDGECEVEDDRPAQHAGDDAARPR